MNLPSARILIDPAFVSGDIDPRIYGGFAEHLGRHIYTGMYEPGHPKSDAHGFRTDVIELVRGLGMPIVRYPGGNFVSGYDWEDGIGPKAERPKRLDLAWGVTETNQFGTNEFMDWCKVVGTEPMLAVNLGTRGVDDARKLVEYCNHPGGTALSDLRKHHGYGTPHAIKTWCLGNEVDGFWQMGTKTATEYGRLAREASKLMKGVDRSIETILCGSSGRGMPTFGTWEWESLLEAYDQVDYVSLHTYYDDHGGDMAAFLAEPENMGDFIREAASVCDAVKATKKSRKTMMLSFDEWNVWFPENNLIDRSPTWPELSKRASDVYDMADVLCVGGMLLTLLENAARVRIACIAQIVNVLAPVLTERGGPAWRQTIWWPFALTSQYGRGQVLHTPVFAPVYDAKNRDAVSVIKSVTVLADTADGPALHIFIINREPSGAPVDVEIDVRGCKPHGSLLHHCIRHDDLRTENTMSHPDAVKPTVSEHPIVDGDTLKLRLSGWSWNLVRVGIDG